MGQPPTCPAADWLQTAPISAVAALKSEEVLARPPVSDHVRGELHPGESETFAQTLDHLSYTFVYCIYLHISG